MKTSKLGDTIPLTIAKSAYEDIMATVGSMKPEQGGILFGDAENRIVYKFVLDRTGRRTGTAYDPNEEFYDRTIEREWDENDLDFIGCIHSHPRGAKFLSGNYGNNTGDMAYISAVLEEFPDMNEFIAPIVFSKADGASQELHCFVVQRDDINSYFEIDVVVVPDETRDNTHQLALDKLEGGLDLVLMQDAHVVCVGVGGANGVCESLVRSGLGTLTIIDFDIVDSSNVVTQGYFTDEVGLSKVEALCNRLKRINPELRINMRNEDVFDIEPFERQRIFGGADVALWMTDSFNAQKLGNDLFVSMQIPSIFAMMYYQGLGSDLSFHVPDLTHGCFQCAFPERFEAYGNGYVNDVTSQGCSNAQISMLNAVISNLTLATLHRNTKGTAYSSWFREGTPNVIQLRQSPKLDSPVFEGMNDFSLCFDSAWFHSDSKDGCPSCDGSKSLDTDC